MDAFNALLSGIDPIKTGQMIAMIIVAYLLRE